jgi:thiol-disulfide isomerase/thioredoxin
MDLMHLKCARALRAVIAVLAGFILTAPALGDKPVRVKRLGMTQMDQMIRDPANRLVVVFLAAWCMPCIKELPDLNEIFIRNEAQGFKIVGFSLDLEGPRAIQPILTKHRVRFPVYWVGEEAVEKYDIKGIPLLWFVRNGQVVETLMGQRSRKFLEAKMQVFFDDGL